MNPKPKQKISRTEESPMRCRTSEWSEGERSGPKRNGEVLHRRAPNEGGPVPPPKCCRFPSDGVSALLTKPRSCEKPPTAPSQAKSAPCYGEKAFIHPNCRHGGCGMRTGRKTGCKNKNGAGNPRMPWSKKMRDCVANWPRRIRNSNKPNC